MFLFAGLLRITALSFVRLSYHPMSLVLYCIFRISSTYIMAVPHGCDLRSSCDCIWGLLTPADWWAGTLNSTDWVITSTFSKRALIGPILVQLPFRYVNLGVMDLGLGQLGGT